MSERRLIQNSFSSTDYCPECNRDLYIKYDVLEYALICEDHDHKKKFRCSACKFNFEICMICLKYFESRPTKSTKSNKRNTNKVSTGYFSSNFLKISCAVLLLFLIIYCVFSIINSKNSNVIYKENVKILNDLRKRYPSQKNETWHHILSVLENEVPTVKSILFLHDEDKRTLQFLTDELVSLYTQNKGIKHSEITFNRFVYDTEDYGILLERCRQIVKRFRIFITNLNKVNGNTARIFHSLCDEISSDIKPSLFIFTLMYNKRTENLKPIEIATSILKEAWNNLPENEIFPLLSRIVKNVVNVISEK